MEGPKPSIQIQSGSQQQTLTGSYHWGNVLDANNINLVQLCFGDVLQIDKKRNTRGFFVEEHNWEGEILA